MHIKQLAGVAGLALAAGGFGTAHAEGITPSSYAATIGVGGSVTIHKTVTVAPGGATDVDIFFLADNTGSMYGVVNSAKSGASTILGALPSSYKYAVGRYYGDPSEPGETTASAYQQLTSFTTDHTTTQNGINLWNASGGGDGPEANFFALKKVAETAGWGAGSQRLVVWFGDWPSHTETTTMSQAIAALNAANVKVIGFNSVGAGGGIDGAYGSDSNQASTIAAATGGNLTNNFTAAGTDFVAKVTSEIVAGTSFIDLAFGATYGGPGLSFSFTCTDPLGCKHVGGGESRTFDVTITGLLPGTYDFNVFASGVGPREHDLITVTAVPEPETYAMMLAGLGVMGAVARRRRGQRSA